MAPWTNGAGSSFVDEGLSKGGPMHGLAVRKSVAFHCARSLACHGPYTPQCNRHLAKYMAKW
jgi:hypothetical protein